MPRRPNSRETGPGADEPLLRTIDLTRHFRLGGMFAKKQVLHAVDDLDLTISRARDRRARRGERQRQEHRGSAAGPDLQAHPGRDLLPRAPAAQPPLPQGPALVPRRGADRLPGPVQRLSPGASDLARGHAQPRPAPAGSESGRAAQARPSASCESVGLSPKMLSRFPYEMSGGERQRIGFAQALAAEPKLILADEPVSMLDVSIRVGVLNMMAGLRDQEGVSLLYITHDLASARYVADRIIVMYAGHLVETGPTETVLSDPKHPYTQLLLSAVADPRDEDASVSADTGEPPRVINPSEGCRFRWRCPLRDREVLSGHAPAQADRTRRRSPATSRSATRTASPIPPARPRSRIADAVGACVGRARDLRLRRRADRLERLAIKVDVLVLRELGLAAERGGGDRAVRRALRPRHPRGDRGAPRPRAARRLGRAVERRYRQAFAAELAPVDGSPRGARPDHAADLHRVERHPRAPALHARA